MTRKHAVRAARALPLGACHSDAAGGRCGLLWSTPIKPGSQPSVVVTLKVRGFFFLQLILSRNISWTHPALPSY